MSSAFFETAEGTKGGDSDGSPPVNIGPGEIQFFDNWMPPLEDGLYRITVTQQIGENVQGAVNWFADPFIQEQKFLVAGPRFTLDPSQIYSVYPPPNAQGDFSYTLPHIVLATRTLPWERTLDGNPPSDYNLPWLALLLFDEDEIIAYSSPPASSPPESPPPGPMISPTLARTYPISEIINPASSDIQGPMISMASIEEEQDQNINCLAIDVPAEVFMSIVPALNELKYLSHVREINTGNKEILGIKADGWFSVVIGNRVPNCPPQTSPPKPGAKNIAHLVSLEGFMPFLPGGSSPPQPIPKPTVRLVSLASWAFSCATTGGNFEYLAEHLDVEQDAALRMPTAWGQSPPVLQNQSAEAEMEKAEELAGKALSIGYVPLNYTMRQGEQTVAWYRGPLTPVYIQPADLPPFTVEEEAMIYDSNTGLFDLSYAVAWQIGRLLALSDRTFALALLNWLRQGHQLVDILQARIYLFQNLGQLLDFPDNMSEMLNAKLMRSLVGSFLTNDFAAAVTPEDPDAAPLLGRGCDPSGLSIRRDEMPGLLTQSELEELLMAGSDPTHALRRKLFGR